MRRSWFDHDMWVMIIAMIWKGYEVIWREWKRILYYIQCWAVICYATFHTLCQYDMVQYTMIWFIWYIMRWTIDWYEHSNCKYSIFILSLYTWINTAKYRLYLRDLTARIQNTYIDTDHLWALRRPMPEGKFPRQARGINKNFPNNQSVP